MGAKILSAEGIEVVTVSNGDAAVKKLQELDVDLVLADVYMPGLDGYEVCERIKSSPEHAGLPVVLLVGALEPFEPDRIAQVHADGVLRKPFEAAAVLDTVRPLLQTSMATRTRRAFAEPEHERTVVIPPPTPPVEQNHVGDTVELSLASLQAAARKESAASHAAEVPPAVAPAPVAPPPSASAPVAPPPAPEPAPPPQEDAPLMAEMALPLEPPPMAEMFVE